MALTNDDIGKIGYLVDDKVDDLKDDIGKKFKTQKSDIFNKIDEVMSELKAMREDQVVITGKVTDHEERLDILEKKVGVAST